MSLKSNTGLQIGDLIHSDCIYLLKILNWNVGQVYILILRTTVLKDNAALNFKYSTLENIIKLVII